MANINWKPSDDFINILKFVEPTKLEQAMSAVAVNSKYRYMENPRQQGKTNKMGCHYTEREMQELRRCGCNQCRERYYHLEREMYHNGRYYEDDYNRPSRALTYAAAPYITGDFATKEAKVTPIEEPKNYAVKLLVDQLKAQQISLTNKNVAIANDKNMIKIYQASLKIKNGEKLAIENKIKELAGALKKLGHKE